MAPGGGLVIGRLLRGILRESRGRDVLGMNRRNLEFIQGSNPRERYRLADDKVIAKTLLDRAGIPTPRTLELIERRDQIDEAIERLPSAAGFVVKPARGFGGSGIVVVRPTDEGGGDEGATLDARRDVRIHMASILSGMFSLDYIDDRVLVEELLHDDAAISAFHGGAGVSDLRVIVRSGIPVMAMLRLPCIRSLGRANLHQHGIGVGIDLATGETLGAIQDGGFVDRHPDTRREVRGLRLPGLAEALAYAARTTEIFEMGFLGVDIVFDADRGPLVLEVNVRPGLAIQLANRRGLRAALEGTG